jgi:hypothetical protein
MMRRVIDGVPCEIVARQGLLLQDYLLVAVAPMPRLLARLQGPRRRVLAGFLLAACCSFVLTGLTVRLLLCPVKDLSLGIEAMRAKNFSFRLPAGAGRDELAVLYSAFNGAMTHLADMELAAVVQTHIMPASELAIGRFRLSASNQMMQATGGDYVDFFPLADGKVCLVLGDVAGHGISAALVTAMAKAAFTKLCRGGGVDPAAVMQRVNRLLLDVLSRKRMMSCILGVLDPQTGHLELANAGQSSPILLDPPAKPSFLRLGSFPLGASKKHVVAKAELNLERQNFVLYSDGLVEALNEQGVAVGYERFAELVENALQVNPQDPGKALFSLMRQETGGRSWDDDASVLFLQSRAAAS